MKKPVNFVLLVSMQPCKRLRIGLFGGSFDPVHLAHIRIAQLAKKQFHLDKVIFIPAKAPPHLIRKRLLDPEPRLEMLNIVAAKHKGFIVSDYELKRKGTTYTYQTIGYFKRKFPRCEFYFIIGSDSLKAISQWKKGVGLLSMCNFIVVPRPSFIKIAKRHNVFYLKKYVSGISSTKIRENILSGGISRWMDRDVLKFVRKNYYYLDDAIIGYLKNNLDSAKYRHTLGVAKTAEKLAKIHGADVRKVVIAALLHDLGRTIPVSKYREFVKKHKVKHPSEYALSAPFLLHSYISAALAQKTFNIKDREILDAIRNHTVGQPRNISTVYDGLLFVADATAPDRRFPRVGYIRKVAVSDLARAVFLAAVMKLSYVLKKNKWISPVGIAVYNSYLKKS